MKRVYLLMSLLCLVIGLPTQFSTAQNDDTTLQGLLLLNILEIGIAENPNHLYVADVETQRVTELLVEDESIFVPWFAWAPDGSKFAYLAPTRQGINNELWLADANAEAPTPRPPLFNLDLTVQVANWHPIFNFIGVGTESRDARDGLYVVNANFENIVFLREAAVPRNGVLDWSRDGTRLAYSSESAALNIYTPDAETTLRLRDFTRPRPALLANARTGWSVDDQFYVFSDDIYQILYVMRTDGSNRYVDIDDVATQDPYQIQLMPNQNQLAAVYDQVAYVANLSDGAAQAFPLALPVEDRYFVLADGKLAMNGFIELPDGDFAECLILDPTTNQQRFARELLPNGDWAHTRCTLLDGGTHLGIMATETLIPYNGLPDDLMYTLFVLPFDMSSSYRITDQYPGFERARLGFSPIRGALAFQQAGAIWVYTLDGAGQQLVTLRDLNLSGDVVEIEYAWQP